MNLDAIPDSFERVKEYFMSWGLFPSEEETGDFNKEVIDQGINRACFDRLCSDVRRVYGNRFAIFCVRHIGAQDDAYYLKARTWAEVEVAWAEYSAGQAGLIEVPD